MNDTETKAPTDPAPWCSMCTNFAVCGNVADPRWSYRGHPFCDGCGIDGSSTADEINAADKAVRLATDAQPAPPDTTGFVVMLWPDANEALRASIEASLRSMLGVAEVRRVTRPGAYPTWEREPAPPAPRSVGGHELPTGAELSRAIPEEVDALRAERTALLALLVPLTCGPEDEPNTRSERAHVALDEAIEGWLVNITGRTSAGLRAKFAALQSELWSALAAEVSPLHAAVKRAGACACPEEP